MATQEGRVGDRRAPRAHGPAVAGPPFLRAAGAHLVRIYRWAVAHPEALLAASLAIAFAFNLWETRGQTFFSDEWGRFLTYNGASPEAYLRGQSGHLIVLHVLFYKSLLELFGAGSYLPFRIVEALLVALSGLLFYMLARSRARPLPCLLATVVLLFLGSAFEVLATPYGIVILLPMVFGLGALVCLERAQSVGDPLACLLLIAAVASQSVGLAFLVGAAVLLALQSGWGALRRSWVVVVPGALYVAWFAWSRLTGPGYLGEPVHLSNIEQVPSSIVAVSAAGLSAVTGLFGSSGPSGALPFDLTAGYLVLGLLVVAVAWRIRSVGPLSRHAWLPVALGVTFWALVGMVASEARAPQASRYIYPSAIFLLLFGLELVRTMRLTRALTIAVSAALVVSLVPNLVNLNQEANRIRAYAATERAELGALELLRAEAPRRPAPALNIHNGVLSVGGQPQTQLIIPAAYYFNAVDRYGSPADTPAEIAQAAPTDRAEADRVLLEGRDLELAKLPADRVDRWAACSDASGSRRPVLVPTGGVAIRPTGPRSGVTVLARRFGTVPQPIRVPGGSGALLLKPGTSELDRPWVALIRGATVCTRR